MKTGDPSLPISTHIVYGFANCGKGYYSKWRYSWNKQKYLSMTEFPAWLGFRLPESHKEQLLHFLWTLRQTMAFLAASPLGKKTLMPPGDIARMLTQLPRRAAFIRSGDDVGVIYSDNLPEPCSEYEFRGRHAIILHQTRQKYCRKVAASPPLNQVASKPQFKRFTEVK